MKRDLVHVVTALLVAACALIPADLGAEQATTEKSDVMIRISGPANVAAGDSVGTVWVIGNTATVSGNVRELVVINGSARINGTVTGNLVLVNGTANLGPSSRIGKDVLLYRSSIVQATGARITGTVHNETGVSFGARTLWLLWLSFTLAMIAAGFVFAWIAGPPLQNIADSMRSEWRGSLATALLLVFGLPTVAVLSFMTGVGFVFGLFILLVLIPILTFVGYVIAGMSLGRAAMGISPADDRKRYTAIALGMLLMQLASVIPAAGGIVLLVSSQLGAGALVYRAWTRGRTVRTQSRLILQPAS
jgi:hypothetical protein